MNAARDSDNPRYLVWLLTPRHRGATALRSWTVLRVSLVFSLFCTWFGGNAWSVCPNPLRKWFFFGELFSSRFQWNLFGSSLITSFKHILCSSEPIFLIFGFIFSRNVIFGGQYHYLRLRAVLGPQFQADPHPKDNLAKKWSRKSKKWLRYPVARP